MIAKITSIIIGFPFPSFHAPNVNFPLRIRGDAAPEYDSSLV
jgi:hypothetical protein